MAYLVGTLFLLSMLTLMLPFLMLFFNNLKKIKGNLTFKAQNRTRKAFYVLPLMSLAFITVAVVIAFNL